MRAPLWPRLPHARLVFTAHSVPISMAEASPYVSNSRLPRFASLKALVDEWKLVYQSRSGPPSQPWLGPDICDYLREVLRGHRHRPIGFLSDTWQCSPMTWTPKHAVCDELGLRMVRAGISGPSAIIRMIAELMEREPEPCAASCCPAPQRPPAPAISR